MSKNSSKELVHEYTQTRKRIQCKPIKQVLKAIIKKKNKGQASNQTLDQSSIINNKQGKGEEAYLKDQRARNELEAPNLKEGENTQAKEALKSQLGCLSGTLRSARASRVQEACGCPTSVGK